MMDAIIDSVSHFLSAVIGAVVLVLVQKIVNRHNLKMHDLEIKTDNRMKYIEKYTEAASECVTLRCSTVNFGKLACSVALYVSDECAAEADKVRKYIEVRDFDTARCHLQKFCSLADIYNDNQRNRNHKYKNADNNSKK